VQNVGTVGKKLGEREQTLTFCIHLILAVCSQVMVKVVHLKIWNFACVSSTTEKNYQFKDLSQSVHFVESKINSADVQAQETPFMKS